MDQYLRVAKAIKMRTFIKMELRLLKLIVMITTIKCLLRNRRHVINDDGIIASFVVAKRGENLIGISDRSLGEVNVH